MWVLAIRRQLPVCNGVWVLAMAIYEYTSCAKWVVVYVRKTRKILLPVMRLGLIREMCYCICTNSSHNRKKKQKTNIHIVLYTDNRYLNIFMYKYIYIYICTELHPIRNGHDWKCGKMEEKWTYVRITQYPWRRCFQLHRHWFVKPTLAKLGIVHSYKNYCERFYVWAYCMGTDRQSGLLCQFFFLFVIFIYSTTERMRISEHIRMLFYSGQLF